MLYWSLSRHCFGAIILPYLITCYFSISNNNRCRKINQIQSNTIRSFGKRGKQPPPPPLRVKLSRRRRRRFIRRRRAVRRTRVRIFRPCNPRESGETFKYARPRLGRLDFAVTSLPPLPPKLVGSFGSANLNLIFAIGHLKTTTVFMFNTREFCGRRLPRRRVSNTSCFQVRKSPKNR